MTADELKQKKVVVLLGGKSAEREVSLNTGRGVAAALEARGYDVETVDVGDDVAERLAATRPAAAFVALHGRFGEDGCIQGLLEVLGIPYTGSGVLASALAMDKVAAKRLFVATGLPVPEYVAVPKDQAGALRAQDLPFGLPCVVKPAREGSSVGISLVQDEDAFAEAVALAARYAGDVLVERYVKGRELSVTVLDGTALGIIEIRPKRAFYDYAAKYDKGSGTEYVYPAPVSEDLGRRLLETAEAAHRVLGCSGTTRVDFLADADDQAFLIEVNTLPGLTETSLVPKVAAGQGIDYGALCEQLLLGASLKA